MKKLQICVLVVLIAIMIGGCKTKPEDEVKQDVCFPENFFEEEGRVTVDCELEIGGDSRSRQRQLPQVRGERYSDIEKAYQIYAAGKDIEEEYHDEGTHGLPDRDSYVFYENGLMSVGPTFSFSTENAKYYSRVGAAREENVNDYTNHTVSFMSGEDAAEQIKKAIKDLGYSEEEFYFFYYPLNWETMRDIESKYVDEELIETGDVKDEWTSDDDAYFVYAFQKISNLPVYHRLMSITHELAFHTVDSAPVQAVYSTRGIEWLYISNIYDFEGEQDVQLQNIDSIIQVVTDKYNTLLSESTYLVNRAKLYVRVLLDEKQDYKTSIIWYFEVQSDNGKKEVMLVDAVSGKEIYLP